MPRRAFRPTCDPLESRLALAGSVAGDVWELYPLRPDVVPIENGTPAFDLVALYTGAEAAALQGTLAAPQVQTMYEQIQDLAAAGLIRGYSVAAPAAPPRTIGQAALGALEDAYLKYSGASAPPPPRSDVPPPMPPPWYEAMMAAMRSALEARVPIYSITP